MKLEKLSILNYKNIEQAELDFSAKINCFFGNNGVGKTNVLDALYYLSFCKSYSNSIDNQNIRHKSNFFVLDAQYRRNELNLNIYCALKRHQRKVFKHDKKEYEKLSDHIGQIPLVFISPDDIALIYDGSDVRRKFVDGVISQYDNEYLAALLRYNKTLQQRNSLLKQDFCPDDLLNVFDEMMAEDGRLIHQRRKTFIEQFIPIFKEYYRNISQERETVDLEYESKLNENDDLLSLLRETHERDRILNYTSRGVHKDDLIMKLGELPIKRVGSQGQNKTYLIALKFAQFDFLERIHREKPMLLLDDIFDKLDSDRVRQIMKLVADEHFGQIFITDTNRKNLDEILNGLNMEHFMFYVENGVINRM